jgi:hypothetical protein
VAEGRFGIGAGYALVTLLVGALASFAGVAAAAAAQRRREGIR